MRKLRQVLQVLSNKDVIVLSTSNDELVERLSHQYFIFDDWRKNGRPAFGESKIRDTEESSYVRSIITLVQDLVRQ